ncbi:PEGA domain-containing protein [Methanogenium cariaci]|uniref:PEGA domain-containing protein n=1 Tax=Methanogenium cariaci TaxID=2197 RepID=UPI00078201ED|nr:PEGA domain-containing protein [Methanogenium cariaci]
MGGCGSAVIANTSFIDNTAGNGGGIHLNHSNSTTIKNCFLDNEDNLAVDVSINAALNYSSVSPPGINIAGGPNLGGNLWITDPQENISETGTDADFNGICDESFAIAGFGTDAFPLVYGGSVQINSSVAGATVYVDGTDTGLLTNRSFYLPVGEHTVSVTLAGHPNPGSQTVPISNSETNDPITFSFSVPIVHPAIWNVSHIAGVGNYTNVSEIPEIGGGGDTIRIWGGRTGTPMKAGSTSLPRM